MPVIEVAIVQPSDSSLMNLKLAGKLELAIITDELTADEDASVPVKHLLLRNISLMAEGKGVSLKMPRIVARLPGPPDDAHACTGTRITVLVYTSCVPVLSLQEWYHAWYHLVCIIAGAGTLAYPASFAYLG